MAKILDKKKQLTDMETMFCHLYVKYNFNATRAYREVYKGKSYNTAGVQANRLLKKTKIEKYVGSLMAECFSNAKISSERILNQLSIQSFQQIDDYVEIDPKTRMTRIRTSEEIGEKGAAVQSLRVKQLSMVTGEDVADLANCRVPVSTEIDIKLRPNEKSLELLMKYSKMITDSVDHNYPGGEFAVTKQLDLSKFSDDQLRQYLALSKLAQNSESPEKK